MWWAETKAIYKFMRMEIIYTGSQGDGLSLGGDLTPPSTFDHIGRSYFGSKVQAETVRRNDERE